MKEFWKLTLNKVILTAIIAAVFYFLITILFVSSGPSGTTENQIFYFSLILSPGLTLIAIPGPTGIYAFFIVSFFYWYFLSCLIVWFYSKPKSKQTQPPAQK